MDEFLDGLHTARKPAGIPPPVARFGKPHGVRHERLESQVATHVGAAQHIGLGGLVAADVEIQVVGQDRVRAVRRNRRAQFLEHESVQAVAAVIQFAAVAADERGWHEKHFSRLNIRLELAVIPHVHVDLIPTAGRLRMDAAQPGEFPADVQAAFHADLHR